MIVHEHAYRNVDTIGTRQYLASARSRKWGVYSLLSTLVVVLAFLPYFRPTAFHMMLATLVAYSAFTRKILPFSLLAMYSGLLLATYAIWADGGIVALNLLFLPIAVSFFKRLDSYNIRLGAKIATIILLIGLFVEILTPELIEMLIYGARGSLDRGYKSFAPEPSFLGFLGFSLMVTFLAFSERPSWVLLAIGISLSSLSLSAILPLAITLLAYLLSARRFLELIAAAAGVAVLVHVLRDMDLRVSYLLNSLISNWDLILLDTSFSNRFVRAAAPLLDASQNNFLPQSFPAIGDIGVSLSFLSDDSDMYIKMLPNLTTILVYVFGFMSFPLFIYYAFNVTSKFYLVIAVFFISNSLLSIAIGYLFLLIALSLRGDMADESRTVE